ncbi:hypothetical protein [Sphaerochaeta halotolerans]|uniref:hypothetical protein n=1 Tax=Sphaerochaeta halotolerans TaxID=2293840 RepID=UPI00136AC679|nr:hypothetical protein [Sphaerochaeta halotolerans]MXI85812.1 hypothetical protein [Sphaerochaeta halotolerans]
MRFLFVSPEVYLQLSSDSPSQRTLLLLAMYLALSSVLGTFTLEKMHIPSARKTDTTKDVRLYCEPLFGNLLIARQAN